MRQLPITLAFFATTAGHCGRLTDWRLTLNDIDRQVPLVHFGSKVASLKVSPGDEALGHEMEAELITRGFKVIRVVGAWQKGVVHQVAYNQDIVRLSQHPEIHAQPFVWWIEDDGAIRVHNGTLSKLLAESMRMLDADANLISVRLRRRSDDRGPTVPSGHDDQRFFYSEDFNFQPAILRSRDFQLAALCVERNPQEQARRQIEQLWRMVLDQFTRDARRHAVWECDVAESIHLGVPQADHEAVLCQLGLSLAAT